MNTIITETIEKARQRKIRIARLRQSLRLLRVQE
jgi:hypothetical protein